MNKGNSAGQIVVAVGIGLLLAVAGSDMGETSGPFSLFLLFVALAFLIQWIAFVPSFLKRTEHYYDLVGSLTYQGITILALLLTENRDLRTVLLGLMILVWAMRLGSFLFRRVKKHGKDGRFDKIKQDPMRFLMAWTVQGLWVCFTAAAAWAAMSSGDKTSFGVIGVVGALIWLTGFGIEVVADQQKSRWRAEPTNEGTFITGGLWDWSRHPNYFGEFLLWLGVAVIAFPALQGWQYATLLSPVFVFILLTRVSGVPALEARSDKKWGGQPDYEEYKARVPVFFPKPPG